MSREGRELFLEWLKTRWSEKPDYSFGNLVAQLTYLAAGHTETVHVSDDDMLDSMKKGWRVL